jgi:hypothetical protein
LRADIARRFRSDPGIAPAVLQECAWTPLVYQSTAETHSGSPAIPGKLIGCTVVADRAPLEQKNNVRNSGPPGAFKCSNCPSFKLRWI